MKTQFEFVAELPKQIEQQMRKGHEEYEAQHGLSCNYRQFSIVARQGDKVVGALVYYTVYAEIYVDDLWVDKDHRNQGTGRSLLEELEGRYTNSEFNNINLVTSEFQAPSFYEKCGFTREFVRINHSNPKLNKSFFVKFF